MSAETSSWRVPVQERSRRRFQDILDAAALELDATSFDRLSLDAVARRAGSSVGSVYRYFPDKLSLVEALLHSHGERLSALFDDDAPAGLPLEEVVLSVSERYELLIRTSPGMAAIAAASLVDRDARRMFRAGMAPLETGMLAALSARFPHLGQDRLATVATVVMRLAESLMTVATTANGPGRDAVLNEIRMLIRGYAAELASDDG